ncbi:Bis(5'-nucleosyl)-tetraphosphatase (symmetrical) YqeK / putative Nicotinate-nucleotide adenylyltransferase [[Mycoplasma] cavipharyngis]|uniref:bis(5'-nucleosyl)-tetraphosphatase (symmetrical) YqeK n=1 Tax=[Mycoplasma] cavipharyngis TaxID=92757 RepID=UPI003704C383
MSQKIIIYTHPFDPISNFNIHIANEAAIATNADIVYLVPSYYGPYGKKHLSTDQERLHMCRLAIPHFYKPVFRISSYELLQKEKSNCYDTLEYFQNLHPDAELFLLVDIETLTTFTEIFNVAKIVAIAQIICYKNPNQPEINFGYWAHQKILYLNDVNYLNHKTSLGLKPQIENLHPKVLEYINQYGVFAHARLKENLSEKRYQHCLTVAKTAIKITQIYNQIANHWDQSEKQRLVADVYIAGLYHDLCKEFKPRDLIDIARNQLKIKWWPSYQVLHGPVAAWWLKNKYFINNNRILSAVAQHTIPIENNPEIATKIIFLADHLEPKRLEDWGKEKFHYFWNLIENQQIDQCYQEVLVALKNLHSSSDNETEKFVYPLKF